MKYKKGTFLVIPNRNELEGKPCEMQTLYFWLCSYANDEGSCFPSRATLAKSCNFSSLRTVDKYIDMLVELGFIGKTKRKRKGGKSYISNLYQVRVLNAPPSALDDTTPSASNSTITVSNLNSNNPTVEIGKAEAVIKKTKKQIREESPFIFKEELELLRQDKWKPKKIIYNYFLKKSMVFENRKQFDSAVGRFITPAQKLEGYSSSQIDRAMDYFEEKKLSWTLETISKNISEVVNRK